MKFINLTRRTEIGANCYHLTVGGRGIILDCGMHPKEEGDDALPNLAAIADRPVDAIIVSHAHLDHVGSLPVLMRQQPKARIFMTGPTAQIADALLHNSVNVMTRQRDELGLTMYPLYGHRETDHAMKRWRHCPFRQQITLEGERAQPNDEITFEFWNAGHVLGAAGVMIRAEGRTIFYTGDVNFDDQTLTKAADFPREKIDVLISETTHGATPQAPGFRRSEEEKRFATALNRVLERGGCVLIPVFALGKTQEVLAILYKLRKAGTIGDLPIYIGGLSSKMTQIYDKLAHKTPRALPSLELLAEMRPFVLNGQTIREAPARPGRIYALSSGMMTPKTLSNIFAHRVLEQPENAVFFVGYADPESPAGILRQAERDALVSLDEDEPAVHFRCAMENFQFSAHASRESLLDYMQQLAARKVFLVHGDPPAVEWMQAAATSALPESEIIIPRPGEEIEL